MIDFSLTWQCRHCRFWDVIMVESGYCRRYAPRGVVEVAIEDDDDDAPVVAVWPVTHHDDWCGEYVPDRSGAND
jgi:hypothetical protein